MCSHRLSDLDGAVWIWQDSYAAEFRFPFCWLTHPLCIHTATWLRGRPGTTIQIFNPYLEVAYTKSLKKLPPEVDCTSDTA